MRDFLIFMFPRESPLRDTVEVHSLDSSPWRLIRRLDEHHEEDTEDTLSLGTTAFHADD